VASLELDMTSTRVVVSGRRCHSASGRGAVEGGIEVVAVAAGVVEEDVNSGDVDSPSAGRQQCQGNIPRMPSLPRSL
jgi:hypothetical protein